MAGIARTQSKMSVSGAHGESGPDPIECAQSVTNWVGPFSITIATGVSEQSLVVLGTQGLTTITNFWATSDVAVSITYGTANVNVPVPLGAGGVHSLAKTSLTAIAVSNSSGGDAVVTYMAGGS